MEFDENEEEEEQEQEEETGNQPNYEMPQTAQQMGRAPARKGRSAGGGGVGGYRYRECLKNHAVGIGGHAVDGCGEFMPSGDEGSLDALICAACGCHRNFHRKEPPELSSGQQQQQFLQHHNHHQSHGNNQQQHQQLSPFYRAGPAGYLQHHMAPGPGPPQAHQRQQLALPAISREEEDVSNPSSSGGGGGGSTRKRFRTRFTQEQKDRMLEFAGRVGWRIQKQDEAAVEQFCGEIGVRRQVLKAAASIKDGKRILFQFDRAAFSFKFLPFKVPYPVPFRLLGDEAKGWLDTTYLSHSGNLHISRGNKGTTFVLQKNNEPRQILLEAISKDKGVVEAIDEFISLNKNAAKGEPELLEGEWKMIWTSQVETDSWLENAANGLMGMQVPFRNEHYFNYCTIHMQFTLLLIPKVSYTIDILKSSNVASLDSQAEWKIEVSGRHGVDTPIRACVDLLYLVPFSPMMMIPLVSTCNGWKP